MNHHAMLQEYRELSAQVYTLQKRMEEIEIELVGGVRKNTLVPTKRSKWSPEARARISKAMKARWAKIKGTARIPKMRGDQSNLIRATMGRKEMRMRDISKATGLSSKQVHSAISRMSRTGEAQKVDKGTYKLVA